MLSPAQQSMCQCHDSSRAARRYQINRLFSIAFRVSDIVLEHEPCSIADIVMLFTTMQSDAGSHFRVPLDGSVSNPYDDGMRRYSRERRRASHARLVWPCGRSPVTGGQIERDSNRRVRRRNQFQTGPATSRMSPAARRWPSAATGVPLTLGGLAPSTGTTRTSLPVRCSAATCTPARPTRVSLLAKGTSCPARAPVNTLIAGTGSTGEAGSAALASPAMGPGASADDSVPGRSMSVAMSVAAGRANGVHRGRMTRPLRRTGASRAGWRPRPRRLPLATLWRLPRRFRRRRSGAGPPLAAARRASPHRRRGRRGSPGRCRSRRDREGSAS